MNNNNNNIIINELSNFKTIYGDGKKSDKDCADIYYKLFGKVFSGNESRRRLYGINDLYLKCDKLEENTTNITKNITEIKEGNIRTSEKLITMSQEESKDIKFLLKAHGYDENEWELINAKNSIWNIYSKKDGKSELYSSKITVKPRTSILFTTESINKLYEQISYNIKSNEYIKNQQYSKDGKILEIEIPDFHWGMLAWGEESGKNWDLKIAEKYFLKIINDIISKVKDFKIKQILFIFSHDFFHANNKEGTTNKGTLVSCDGRIQKIFNKGVEVLVRAIEILREIAPVETFYIQGNHSADVGYYAMKFIEAWFKDDKDVMIDTKASPRKYKQFGKCLIGFAHGDNEGKRINNLMEKEVPELYGKSIYREFHLGHLHHEKVLDEDYGGVIIRYMPTIIPQDNWHNEQGFIGSVKRCQSFIWDENNGLDMIINTNVIYDD